MSRNTDETSAVVSESPLVGIDFNAIGLSPDILKIAEVPFLSHINIRGKIDNERFIQATTQVLGVALPMKPNSVCIKSELSILWYGPSEWLVLAPSARGAELCSELRSALGDTHSLVCDISGGNTVIDITGTKARDLIKKATTIDVHPSVFTTGDSALTTFAHASAAMYQYANAPGFRIIVRRSFADYIGTWLLDAAREFVS